MDNTIIQEGDKDECSINEGISDSEDIRVSDITVVTDDKHVNVVNDENEVMKVANDSDVVILVVNNDSDVVNNDSDVQNNDSDVEAIKVSDVDDCVVDIEKQFQNNFLFEEIVLGTSNDIWSNTNFVGNSKLYIQEFPDYVPQNEKCYFGVNPQDLTQIHHNDNDHENRKPVMIIGVVFYNEEAIELKRTLYSLVEQIAELDGKCSYQVIFVGDGYKQMSLSAKLLFKELFTSSSNENDVYEWDRLMDVMESQIQETHTYVIQRVFQFDKNYYKRSLIKLKEKQIYLSLVLKTNNRRKHNSQEWILNAFATQAVKIDSQSRHYIFMSDCGTLYVKKEFIHSLFAHH